MCILRYTLAFVTPKTQARITRSTAKLAKTRGAAKAALAERNAAICAAREEGASLREIGVVAGMTPMAVSKILYSPKGADK